MTREEYERQPAPEFLFRRRPVPVDVDQRSANGEGVAWRPRAVLVAGNQPPHRQTRRSDLVISGQQARTLTITADPHNEIVVLGTDDPDWKIALHAEGDGRTEAEAHASLQQIALNAAGNTLALSGAGLYDGINGRGKLVVQGPREAGVVVHASYTAVDVRDMIGPVRIAATHARATILETTGPLDATAGIVDFAGSRGRITLSAEMEINLKMTARLFDGVLVAWAERAARMLVPPGFTTPMEVMVSTRDKFVCRADFASSVKQTRQGELYVFTFDPDSARSPRPTIHLRSEQSMVVIDTVSRQ